MEVNARRPSRSLVDPSSTLTSFSRSSDCEQALPSTSLSTGAGWSPPSIRTSGWASKGHPVTPKSGSSGIWGSSKRRLRSWHCQMGLAFAVGVLLTYVFVHPSQHSLMAQEAEIKPHQHFTMTVTTNERQLASENPPLRSSNAGIQDGDRDGRRTNAAQGSHSEAELALPREAKQAGQDIEDSPGKLVPTQLQDKTKAQASDPVKHGVNHLQLSGPGPKVRKAAFRSAGFADSATARNADSLPVDESSDTQHSGHGVHEVANLSFRDGLPGNIDSSLSFRRDDKGQQGAKRSQISRAGERAELPKTSLRADPLRLHEQAAAVNAEGDDSSGGEALVDSSALSQTGDVEIFTESNTISSQEGFLASTEELKDIFLGIDREAFVDVRLEVAAPEEEEGEDEGGVAEGEEDDGQSEKGENMLDLILSGASQQLPEINGVINADVPEGKEVNSYNAVFDQAATVADKLTADNQPEDEEEDLEEPEEQQPGGESSGEQVAAGLTGDSQDSQAEDGAKVKMEAESAERKSSLEQQQEQPQEQPLEQQRSKQTPGSQSGKAVADTNSAGFLKLFDIEDDSLDQDDSLDLPEGSENDMAASEQSRASEERRLQELAAGKQIHPTQEILKLEIVPAEELKTLETGSEQEVGLGAAEQAYSAKQGGEESVGKARPEDSAADTGQAVELTAEADAEQKSAADLPSSVETATKAGRDVEKEVARQSRIAEAEEAYLRRLDENRPHYLAEIEQAGAAVAEERRRAAELQQS